LAGEQGRYRATDAVSDRAQEFSFSLRDFAIGHDAGRAGSQELFASARIGLPEHFERAVEFSKPGALAR
jgi:hypothetical protein